VETTPGGGNPRERIPGLIGGEGVGKHKGVGGKGRKKNRTFCIFRLRELKGKRGGGKRGIRNEGFERTLKK